MVRPLAPRDARKLIDTGELDVVDVREHHEWAAGHVPGARNVPLRQLREDVDVAELGARVLFVCERGPRSEQAAQLVEASPRAVAEISTLEGGTAAWRAEGLPIELPEKADAPGAAHADSLAPVDDAEAELDAVVGANLKRLRSERGWSLDVLAGVSGVGRQTLGQIEVGRTVPSLGALWKIARAFEVPFSALLAGPTSRATRIFRRTPGATITDADGRFSSRALFSPDDKGGFEFYELFLAAHGREDAEPHALGTREHLLVTEGRLVLELGSERFELAEGDAIAFTADVRHAYVNASNKGCRMSLVMTYPAFQAGGAGR
jgi:rhodanese-related sulfurtransferase/transcriptional regulator with XRE-family HTH domain